MAYSGKFVRTATDNTKFQSRTNWGTGVDPGHADPLWGEDQGFPALTNPPMADVPEAVTDDYDPTRDNPSLRAPEQEPKGHGGSGRPPRSANEYDEIASDTARHQENFGATLKNTAVMVMRSITQTFASPRVESLRPPTDDASAGATGAARRALRGFNSLAQNNPGSPEVNYSGNYIRQGKELYRWTDRSMPRRKLTHDKRPIYLNVAATAHVTTSPQGANYSPYGSPFRSVAALNVGTQRPMTRREPRAWDENARTDGTEDMYAQDTSQYSSWGL
jgi:hypothetical protein